ncbi:MAG: endonuclease MutS2, partial [Bdellovibrionaceae bacterium]|nr:endonuclease MutS2 [Pseudobdellovibrionaceae bacterium]
MKFDAIDWQLIKNQLKELCTSDISRESVDNLTSYSSVSDVKHEYNRLDTFIDLLKLHPRPRMESLDLYYTWATRLEKNALLKPIELRDLRSFCIEVLALKETLLELDTRVTGQLLEGLLNPEEPLSAIDQIVNSDGSIRSDASEKLHSLYNEKNSLNKNISNTLDKLVKRHELENLIQDKFVTTREGRRVIPVKSNLQSQISGIIHASSHSNKTVYMEPQEVVPMNNRLRQVEYEIEEEIETLLKQLSDYLYDLRSPLEIARDVMTTSDLLYAKAHLAQLLNAHRCEFSENEIELLSVRHPGLVLQNEDVIPNTVKLNDHQRILLLTGPNAGGKTILLKAVGLAALMVKHGLYICAEEKSKMPLIDNFHIAVGDLQSVDDNMSTFAGHLKILNEALEAKGPKSLILVDEICGSTDPEEGSALARSFLLRYLEQNSFSIITSHLSPLKLGWKENSGLINGSLEYNSDTGKPTYQFLMGIPGESLAIQTAQRVGVDQEVVNNALELLTPERRLHQKKIMEVDSLKEELLKMHNSLNQQLKETEKERKKYQKELNTLKQEKESILKNELKRAQSEIEEMIEYAKVDETFKKHESLQKIKTKLPQIITSKDTEPKSTSVDSVDDFKKRFPKGTKVYVESVGRDGIVQSEPNARGEVEVMSQSMRLTVDWQTLK